MDCTKSVVDLHTHSHYSDGSLSPYDLVSLAKESGLRAIALTDHDNVDGIREALAAGKELGIEVIAGIEFSAVSTGETHILGYGIDIENKELNEAIDTLKKLRLENNHRTADALQKLGFDVTVEDAKKVAPKGLLGRAHFARVMMDKGYTSSVKEAFDLYLQSGKPAYNSLRLLQPADAIRLITNAGGKAYLAHLHLTKLTGGELDSYVKSLKDDGLYGLEGYYTDYTPEMQDEYQALARKYGLKISGGTDFHGSNKPHIKIGVGYGNLAIPYKTVEDIFG